MNTLIYNKKLYVWIVALTALFLHSCTKTEYREYEPEALTHILEYRVTNATQELLGAIDHTNNTITVYVPYYLSIDYLIAEITLDEGATLLDSLGNEINLDGGLDPLPLGDSVKYIVESASGIQRTYMVLQEILPHPDALEVTYSGAEEGISLLEKPVNSRLTLLGNFESSSMNARFYLTAKATGKVYDDWISVTSVTPGATYTMVTVISPEALEGEYTVRMEHQERATDLPDLKLHYQKPMAIALFSSASYAPADTIIFATPLPAGNDNNAFIFRPMKRAYIKITKGLVNVPATFSEEDYGKEFELEIVSQSRTEVKAIFPEIPAGQYTSNRTTSSQTNNSYGYSEYVSTGFGFYADFEEETGWGNGHIFQAVSFLRFTVL